jgi:tetratricopeptide (TPR) repeat protein
MTVSRDDWFRNTTWNASVATLFEAKLERARDKSQPLRIQACLLADTHPLVALELLERYFNEPKRFGEAQAYVDRATALLALGRHEEAVAALGDALKEEKKMPYLLTQAYVELPYVISVHALVGHYEQAAKVLNSHRKRPVFPVEFFMWHASKALLAGASGDRKAAELHAKEALEFASKEKSVFKRHPKLGLVSKRHNDALLRLREYCHA